MSDLRAQWGNIDIYWFDQTLRGLITPDMRTFAAGCGGGLLFTRRTGSP